MLRSQIGFLSRMLAGVIFTLGVFIGIYVLLQIAFADVFFPDAMRVYLLSLGSAALIFVAVRLYQLS